MTKEIKCNQCDEVLGILNKPVITEQDEIEYAEMVACSLEHIQSVQLVNLEEQE